MAEFIATTATNKICEMRGRYRAVAGGTSASKTISILFWLIDRAIAFPPANNGETELISVVSETYNHLERGAMLDFENIMKSRGYWKDARWHGTKHTYTFETGSKIEFLSIDTYGKAHGPRRDILYINEANNLQYNIADQLMTRTRKIIWLDWNPSEEFWFYTDMLTNPLLESKLSHITLTYLDNEALDQESVDGIESHRHNRSWWQVYGLGQLGEVEGRIFTGWNLTLDRREIPTNARLERRGLDFGYSQDPAALVDVYYYDGGYILDERLYMRGQSNRQLSQFVLNLDNPDNLLVADSAEPKSIDELAEFGVQVVPAEKGPGSLNRSIRNMQGQRITVTKQSYNLIKEYRRYFWKTDRDGNILTVPEGGNDHLLDAARYALESLRPSEDDSEVEYDTGSFARTWA